MKVIIVCNSIIPKIAESLGYKIQKPESWLIPHIAGVQSNFGTDVIVLFPDKKELSGYAYQKIKYYSYYPDEKDSYNRNAYRQYVNILNKEKPDVIHVFGTEFPHTLSLVDAAIDCKMIDRLLISIQGLVSVYAEHFYANLPERIVHSYTLRDILKNNNIAKQKNLYTDRGKFEIEAIKKAKHVIGRTDWDKACVMQINPNINYHFCNESLRDSFYQNKWCVDLCEKYSIFVSQASYPIKGFHNVLEAIRIVATKYPFVKLYTTGPDPRDNKNFLAKIKETYYTRYLRELICKYKLEKNVVYLGFLNEKEMCEQYLKAHVFVSASSIENSPNSLGEAMILGVPCISSDVGGVKNLLTHSDEGFIYQADAPYMLAYYITEIFNSDTLAIKISENARKHALCTHDVVRNQKRMSDIYHEIVGLAN